MLTGQSFNVKTARAAVVAATIPKTRARVAFPTAILSKTTAALAAVAMKSSKAGAAVEVTRLPTGLL